MISFEVLLPGLAALFAYLSWKRNTMGSAYELEDAIRNRLKNSANVTNYYYYQLGRVQVAEYGGRGYPIWKYLPIIGGIQGETIVYLYFSSIDEQAHPNVPPVEEIKEHPMFESMPISSIQWKDEVANAPAEYVNLEIVYESVNPDVILKSITDLSGVMMELNSEENDRDDPESVSPKEALEMLPTKEEFEEQF